MADASSPADPESLAARAYAAFAAGDLVAARAAFDALLAAVPDDPAFRYMQGLTCKYLGDWGPSLRHNLQALHVSDSDDDDREAMRWNAAIAATALGDWAEARRQWADCGIAIPPGTGPIDGNFGVASLRLEAWGQAETLFARRIDPVRARLINVPLPDTGYRYGDVVLHDGASTGERFFHQSRVPVLNALRRLETSAFRTFAVFATCPEPGDLDALLEMRGPGIGLVEDWTASIVHLCLRCSYGVPHRHRDATDAPEWRPERNLGFAAQSGHAVQRLIERWKAAAPGRGRRLDAIEHRDREPGAPPVSGIRWWLAPEDRDEAATDAQPATDD